MDMRRPLYIGARSVSLFSQRMKGQLVVWQFQDVIKAAIPLIMARPQLPTIQLPNNVGDTVSNTVTNPPVKVRDLSPMGIQRYLTKKQLTKLRRKLGI